MGTHHGSLGSGRLLFTDIRSLAYWLNAFLFQPSETALFISADMLAGNMTALPSSPGASAPAPPTLSWGAARTPKPGINRKYYCCELYLILIVKYNIIVRLDTKYDRKLRAF